MCNIPHTDGMAATGTWYTWAAGLLAGRADFTEATAGFAEGGYLLSTGHLEGWHIEGLRRIVKFVRAQAARSHTAAHAGRKAR